MSRINYLAKGTLNVLKRVLPPLLAVGGTVAIGAVTVTVSNLIKYHQLDAATQDCIDGFRDDIGPRASHNFAYNHCVKIPAYLKGLREKNTDD